MIKKIVICFCLVISAVTLHFSLGTNSAQSGETSTPEELPKITLLEALKIATDLVPGRVVEAELDDKEDVIFYEIEIISNDGMAVEVQVDANSGQIIKQAREGEVAYISVEEAITSATEFLRWHVVEVELEEEDGKAVYEIKLVNNIGDGQEVEIDALSGKILELEVKASKKDPKTESGKD